ncbi:MAG: glucans biosynthesis glucosyltransferase MdoH [Rhodocyclaceae bacterium]|nr:glucans biosynthesis glucosyltransferase MdoH [Rhodocyclaceae bacterium]
MELHHSAGLRRSAAAAMRGAAYVERLPLAAARRVELRQAAATAKPEAAMAAVHRALAGAAEAAENPADASLAARLALACATPAAAPGSAVAEKTPAIAPDGRRLAIVPAIRRRPLAPGPWPPRLSWWPRTPVPAAPAHRRSPGKRRRAVLAVLTLGQTALATWSMTAVLPYHGREPLEMAILALFAVLFFWVSAGFWTAMMGFLVLLSGGDRHAITASAAADAAIAADARTAIVMPIRDEHVARVFAGLRATYESLARSGALDGFDFFVLSDSVDADSRVAEIEAWLQLCRAVDGCGRIFYRWRRHRIKRKSGNIADFCRRWGANYRYMVVLDADSVMSGACLATLVRLMEANPDAGIIQTAPRAAGRETLHARIQQFANRVYGPLFTAGLHFWQLGEAHYWGHNAIIRVAPFMRHCALGRLPRRGRSPVEILSHDFVEAALMRRAGWGVWIAYDLPGSYEEMPPNLIDELTRDRRWCQGNLINARLFLAEGVHAAHRAVFAIGVMAYLSSPLWFLFLLLSTALLAIHTLVPPQYFTHPYQLFPIWPEWHLEAAVVLFGATSTLLFAPKVLSVALLWRQGARAFGGAARLALSMLGELVYSMLLAPIRMLFHTQFVAAALAGWQVGWKSPPRDDAETTWAEALRRHGWHTLLGLAWAAAVYWLNPSYLWWLLPVVGALALAIPLSVGSSRSALGRRLRRARLFLIPEESCAPPELRSVRRQLRHAGAPHGFAAAVVDPLVNAVACAAGSVRARRGAAARAAQRALVNAALIGGPAALSAQQQLALLDDARALSALHFQVWSSRAAHAAWRAAMGAPPCDDATC